MKAWLRAHVSVARTLGVRPRYAWRPLWVSRVRWRGRRRWWGVGVNVFRWGRVFFWEPAYQRAKEPERLRAELELLRRDLGRAHDLVDFERRTFRAERDLLTAAADDLAAAIGRLTGTDPGDHSSDNDPWQNALDAATRVVSGDG